jgi:hypothetical protein
MIEIYSAAYLDWAFRSRKRPAAKRHDIRWRSPMSNAIEMVERVVVARDKLPICFAPFGEPADDDAAAAIRIPWAVKARNPAGNVDYAENVGPRDEGIVQSIVRAHAWNKSLLAGTHASVEKLAKANGLHPKIVRQALQLAFLHRKLHRRFWRAGSLRVSRWREFRN